jgi:hypothetical protein
MLGDFGEVVVTNAERIVAMNQRNSIPTLIIMRRISGMIQVILLERDRR